MINFFSLSDTLKRFSAERERDNLIFFHANAIKFDGLEEYNIKVRARKNFYYKIQFKFMKVSIVSPGLLR